MGAVFYRAFQFSLIPPSGRDTTLKMAGYLTGISGRVENFGRFESFFFEGPYNIFGLIDKGKLNLG